MCHEQDDREEAFDKEILRIRKVMKRIRLSVCMKKGRQLLNLHYTTSHTSYLSILGHHHTIQACKRGTESAKICGKIAKSGQNGPKFSVFYAKRGTGLKKTISHYRHYY